MLKILILLLAGSKLLAQCPQGVLAKDVRAIPVSVHLLPSYVSLDLCQKATIHNEVIFQMDNDFNLGPNQTCWLNFGDGSPLAQVTEGASENFPACGFPPKNPITL